MFRIINSQHEWNWYKAELDLDRKYPHKHEGGDPAQFPCNVKSELFPYNGSSNGYDEYHHEFYYEHINKCEKCGHEKTFMPKWEDE